jgi:hypothetical protein
LLKNGEEAEEKRERKKGEKQRVSLFPVMLREGMVCRYEALKV